MQKEGLRFFSFTEQAEIFWRRTFIAILLFLTALLLIFWEALRTQDFMTALAEWRPDWLYSFFNIFTILGDDIGIMFIALIIFWCIDKKLGFSAMMVLLAAAIYMHILKSFFFEPRPLEGQQRYDSLSFPSGHTLTTYAVWGYLAVRAKNKYLWIAAVVIAILMGVSRVIIGVHFPGDILGGYIFGTIFLAALLFCTYHFSSRKKNSGTDFFLRNLIVIVIIFTVIALLVLNFYPSDDATMVTGILAGLIIGRVLEERLVRFKTDGSAINQIIKLIIGATLLFLLAKGISFDFLELPHWNIIRFLIAGLWATFLAPYIFVLFKLSPKDSSTSAI